MNTPQIEAAFMQVSTKDAEVKDKPGLVRRYHAIVPVGKDEGHAACDPRLPLPPVQLWKLPSQVDPVLFCRRPGCWRHLRTAARRT